MGLHTMDLAWFHWTSRLYPTQGFNIYILYTYLADIIVSSFFIFFEKLADTFKVE